MGAEGLSAGQMGNDVLMAKLQQLLVQREGFLLFCAAVAAQARLRSVEGLLGIRIGNFFAFVRIGEGAESGEFVAPTFAHQIRQFAVVAGEKQERLLGGEFIAPCVAGVVRGFGEGHAILPEVVGHADLAAERIATFLDGDFGDLVIAGLQQDRHVQAGAVDQFGNGNLIAKVRQADHQAVDPVGVGTEMGGVKVRIGH